MSVHDTALRAAAGTPVSQAPNPCSNDSHANAAMTSIKARMT
jgi:hypothetical protein